MIAPSPLKAKTNHHHIRQSPMVEIHGASNNPRGIRTSVVSASPRTSAEGSAVVIVVIIVVGWSHIIT